MALGGIQSGIQTGSYLLCGGKAGDLHASGAHVQHLEDVEFIRHGNTHHHG